MLRRSLLAGAAALPLTRTARAQQNWPSKPIRLVVGYSPGGGNDLIVRDAERWKAVATKANIRLD